MKRNSDEEDSSSNMATPAKYTGDSDEEDYSSNITLKLNRSQLNTNFDIIQWPLLNLS